MGLGVVAAAADSSFGGDWPHCRPEQSACLAQELPWALAAAAAALAFAEVHPEE